MATKRDGHNEGTLKHGDEGGWEVRISLQGGKRKSLYGMTS